jgi:hypothetical protein
MCGPEYSEFVVATAGSNICKLKKGKMFLRTNN